MEMENLPLVISANHRRFRRPSQHPSIVLWLEFKQQRQGGQPLTTPLHPPPTQPLSNEPISVLFSFRFSFFFFAYLVVVAMPLQH